MSWFWTNALLSKLSSKQQMILGCIYQCVFCIIRWKMVPISWSAVSVLYINVLYVCDCSMHVWYGTVRYLWVIFMIVCRVIDTLANIYALKVVMCMCLYRGGGGPLNIFAPPPMRVMVMRVMLSCGRMNKQASDKQTSTRRTSEFSGDDLLRWGPKLFVLPHD